MKSDGSNKVQRSATAGQVTVGICDLAACVSHKIRFT